MAKSRGRKFAELISPTNGVFAAGSLPTIPASKLPTISISKLEDSTFSVNSESASLGGNVVIDSNDVTEHTNALYFTNARADARITAAALLPLAGGTMTGNLTLGDNVNAYFGASTDLRIYHDGTNSHIINSTGELRITGSNIAIKSDSNKLYLGAGDDLKIYHDGSNSYIEDAGTGSLILKGGTISVNGAYTLPISDGSANQVLQTDGSGTLSFANAGSGSSVFSTSGSNAYYTSGNVGIGTSSPDYQLHIAGGGDFLVEDTGNGSAHIRLRSSSSGTASSNWKLKTSNNNFFYIENDTGSAGTAITIDNTGKVGIGTNSPSHGLTVSDSNVATSAARRITIKSLTHGANAGFRFDAESADGTARAAGTYFQPGNTDSTTYLGLSADDSSNHLVVTRAGRVGIGITTPAFNLHAYHATTNVVARFESGDSSVWIDLHDSDSGTYGALLGHDSTNLFKVADSAAVTRMSLSNSGTLTADRFYSGLGTAASPAFQVGDTNSGFFDSGSNTIGIACSGAHEFDFSGSRLDMLQNRLDNVSEIRIVDANTKLSEGAGNAVRITTNSGWVDVGAQNTTWVHFQTDRGKFYFEKSVHFDEQIYNYAGGGTSDPYWRAGNDGSGSGLDADLLDGLHASSFMRASSVTNLDMNDYNIFDITNIQTNGANADVKFSVWSGTTYGIGMHSGVTLGHLNDYAMTFCMNNDSDRGFWWGYSGQGKSAGAMSLTTGGKLWITNSAQAYSYQGHSNVAGTGNASYHPSGIYSTGSNWLYGTMYLNGNSVNFSGGNIASCNDIVCDNNYGRGVVGVYSATRYQHVWSMGAAYRTNAAGTSYGNMYGLTYTHTNIGTGTNQAISGLSHQLQGRQNGTLTWAMGTGIWTSGNVTAYSDIAVKTNLQKIPNALEKVCAINGYTYERTDYEADPETGEMPETRQAGVVAQEVEKVLPEVVSGEEGNKAVAYGNMVSLLIEAIKEQQGQIEDLKQEIETLKGES